MVKIGFFFVARTLDLFLWWKNRFLFLWHEHSTIFVVVLVLTTASGSDLKTQKATIPTIPTIFVVVLILAKHTESNRLYNCQARQPFRRSFVYICQARQRSHRHFCIFAKHDSLSSSYLCTSARKIAVERLPCLGTCGTKAVCLWQFVEKRLRA